MRALVVDDEEDLCDLVKEYLQQLNFETSSCLTGEEALLHISRQNWDLFVIDIKLATAVTGIDLMREIRTKQPRAVMVAITGYIDIGLQQEAEKLGVKAYLLKPDDLKEEVFLKKITTLLPSARLS